jgi:hypothetical protein
MTKPDPTTPSAESEGKHAQATAPKPRVKRPNRNQMELVSITLDGTIPAEHEVRLIWEFVEHVDLTPWYAAIRAVEGRGGARCD